LRITAIDSDFVPFGNPQKDPQSMQAGICRQQVSIKWSTLLEATIIASVIQDDDGGR
jgi:hypothetical protein